MTGLLLTRSFLERSGDAIDEIERTTGTTFDRIALPDDADARLTPEEVARIEIAFMAGDVYPQRTRSFFAAVHGAPNLRWLHLSHTGVDHPVFQRFLERGVTLTNSPGVNGVQIAQTAFAALLMLGRGFPGWMESQRKRSWDRTAFDRLPVDFDQQTVVVLGLGGIGRPFAALARSLGLHVIGVRRSPRTEDDPVDELHPPEALDALLPRADWLAITIPLDDATRGLIDARRIALLPDGARVLNVARGEILDEGALIEALRRGELGGAYLDVFEVEPLPAESPLWDLPNVLITPHASSVSSGGRARQAHIFLDNLGRFARREPLHNRVERQEAP